MSVRRSRAIELIERPEMFQFLNVNATKDTQTSKNLAKVPLFLPQSSAKIASK